MTNPATSTTPCPAATPSSLTPVAGPSADAIGTQQTPRASKRGSNEPNGQRTPAEPRQDLQPGIGELFAGRQARRLARNIMVALAANPGGMTVRGIADFLACSHNRLYRVLPVLRDAGMVQKDGRLWTAAP